MAPTAADRTSAWERALQERSVNATKAETAPSSDTGALRGSGSSKSYGGWEVLEQRKHDDPLKTRPNTF